MPAGRVVPLGDIGPRYEVDIDAGRHIAHLAPNPSPRAKVRAGPRSALTVTSCGPGTPQAVRPAPTTLGLGRERRVPLYSLAARSGDLSFERSAAPIRFRVGRVTGCG